MDYVESRSTLPWLHIAEVVASEVSRRGFRRVGLTGTQWLVESSVYPDKLSAFGIECQRPDEEKRRRLNEIIMEELVCGTFRAESISYLQALIEAFRVRGCDAVVLGCTELPLVLTDADSPLPALDSTRLLARAALKHAIES
jgi:aspartate racemase